MHMICYTCIASDHCKTHWYSLDVWSMWWNTLTTVDIWGSTYHIHYICIFMRMYPYIYYVYMYIHLCRYTCTFMRTYCTCMHICLCSTYLQTHTHTHIYICIFIYTYVHICYVHTGMQYIMYKILVLIRQGWTSALRSFVQLKMWHTPVGGLSARRKKKEETYSFLFRASMGNHP